MTTDAKKMVDACAPAAETGSEHESIARFEGTWRAEVKMWMDPSGEPHVSQGTMVNTMVLGGRFLQEEYKDDSGMFEGKGFWGYNTIDKRYEGFWIDSMATFFQLERGQHDPASDSYNMEGSMTDPGSGKPMTKRSVIKALGPDEHVMEMYFKGEQGAEMKCMEIHYKRA